MQDLFSVRARDRDNKNDSKVKIRFLYEFLRKVVGKIIVWPWLPKEQILDPPLMLVLVSNCHASELRINAGQGKEKIPRVACVVTWKK